MKKKSFPTIKTTVGILDENGNILIKKGGGKCTLPEAKITENNLNNGQHPSECLKTMVEKAVFDLNLEIGLGKTPPVCPVILRKRIEDFAFLIAGDGSRDSNSEKAYSRKWYIPLKTNRQLRIESMETRTQLQGQGRIAWIYLQDFLHSEFLSSDTYKEMKKKRTKFAFMMVVDPSRWKPTCGQKIEEWKEELGRRIKWASPDELMKLMKKNPKMLRMSLTALTQSPKRRSRNTAKELLHKIYSK